MKASQRISHPAALEKRALEIVRFCQQLISAMGKSDDEAQRQVIAALVNQADRAANLRYKAADREARQKFAEGNGSAFEPTIRNLARTAAQHPGQPTVDLADFDGSIDFLSDAHIDDLIHAVGRLRVYAARIAATERKKRSASKAVGRSKRGRPANVSRFNQVFPEKKQQALELDIRRAKRVMYEKDLLFKPPGAVFVARKLGVSCKVLYDWRKDPAYRTAFERGAIALVIAALHTQLESGASQSRIHLDGVIKNPRPHVEVEVRKHWTGPVRSLFDGKTYDTPEAYTEHLIAHGLLPQSVVTDAREADRRDDSP